MSGGLLLTVFYGPRQGLEEEHSPGRGPTDGRKQEERRADAVVVRREAFIEEPEYLFVNYIITQEARVPGLHCQVPGHRYDKEDQNPF